jgi:hypothetical protein
LNQDNKKVVKNAVARRLISFLMWTLYSCVCLLDFSFSCYFYTNCTLTNG